MARLAGKVAFVTGAARGQGRSHAVRLAREGADIIAVDVLEPIPGATYPGATEADLAETVRLVEENDRRVVASKADVRDLAGLTKAVDEGVGQLGRLDIVVANAGILTRTAPAHELTDEEWTDLVDVNLNGVWRTVRAAVPHLKAGGRGGVIILTSSAAALKAGRNVSHYASAKLGVVALMRALALELAADNIRVNTLHPTQVDTPMIQNQHMYERFRPDLEHPTRADFAEASMGLNALEIPWIEPSDVSDAVAFLASDEAKFITGVQLPVDAGLVINR